MHVSRIGPAPRLTSIAAPLNRLSVYGTSNIRPGADRSGQLCPDRLRLEIRLEPLAAVLAPEPGGLVAAERRAGVDLAPAVHVDRARLQQGGQAMRVADVARPHPRRQPVLAVVGPRRDLLERLVGERDQDRPEDLLAGNLEIVAAGREQR